MCLVIFIKIPKLFHEKFPKIKKKVKMRVFHQKDQFTVWGKVTNPKPVEPEAKHQGTEQERNWTEPKLKRGTGRTGRTRLNTQRMIEHRWNTSGVDRHTQRQEMGQRQEVLKQEIISSKSKQLEYKSQNPVQTENWTNSCKGADPNNFSSCLDDVKIPRSISN